VVFICIGFSFNVLADEIIKGATYVSYGEKVLVDSMCFTIPYATRLKVELEYCDNKISYIELDRIAEKLRAEHLAFVVKVKLKYQLDLDKCNLLVEKERNDFIVVNDKFQKLSNDYINLNNSTNDFSSGKKIVWFSVGVGTAAVIIFGSIYFVSLLK
jgi:hypothetical protein